jgi:hypothetical protein
LFGESPFEFVLQCRSGRVRLDVLLCH